MNSSGKISLLTQSRQFLAIALFWLLICLITLPTFAQMRVSGARSNGKASINKKSNKKVSAKRGKAARTSDDDYQSEAERIDVPVTAQSTVEEIM